MQEYNQSDFGIDHLHFIVKAIISKLCFKPAKNVLYISLDCHRTHSTVVIILFSALYLCPELVTLKKQMNKDPTVERQKEGKERRREGRKKAGRKKGKKEKEKVELDWEQE